MIYFNFTLENPFSDQFSLGRTWYGVLSHHKAYEIRIGKTDNIIGVALAFSIRRDHAGGMIELELFGRSFCAQYYDTRHWDYENNCWECEKTQ